MIYELIGFNTDRRYDDDIRYRKYTRSLKRAERFNRIPKIQFTDSEHGIVFSVIEHRERIKNRKPEVRILDKYVRENLVVFEQKE